MNRFQQECEQIKAECDKAGKPYPWADKGHFMVFGGDAIVRHGSNLPMVRYTCPKCGYALTTNYPEVSKECPRDGATCVAD